MKIKLYLTLSKKAYSESVPYLPASARENSLLPPTPVAVDSLGFLLGGAAPPIPELPYFLMVLELEDSLLDVWVSLLPVIENCLDFTGTGGSLSSPNMTP